ncbi:hypothetical protein ACWD04_29830 [Streptomyces sp. NPDC002911]
MLIYGWPLDDGARTPVRTVREAALRTTIERFVLFDEETYPRSDQALAA